MTRTLGMAHPGAIYHVMARGNAWQAIFRDERDYGRFCRGISAIRRSGSRRSSARTILRAQ